MKNIFKRDPYRYMIVVKQKEGSEKKNEVFYYNTNRSEIMQDVYWAFEFIDADYVSIRSTKNRKRILAEFNNVNEWKNSWNKMFGSNVNYFVLKDRH